MSEDEEDERGGGEGKRRSTDLIGGQEGGSGSADPPPFWDQVLENVLENVLQFLDSRRDRNAASLVCWSWCRAEAQTRRDLFIGNCYAVSPARTVERFRSVRALVIKGKPRFADFNLVPPRWGAGFSPWLAALGPAYPWLERLCLKRMSVSDEDLHLIPLYFPSLRDFTLICCDGFGPHGLARIAEYCRHLRVLDLIDTDLEGGMLDWVSRISTTSLESLVFDCVGSPVNSDALEALVARSPSLRRLRVNHHVPVGCLRHLMERAPQLTHLGTGSFCEGWGWEVEVADLEAAFAASRSLVCLSGFQELAPKYLPAIYPACANLTSLNLSLAHITAKQLRRVIIHCHNLQTFWVLDTVGDEGLQVLAAKCKDLRDLRVYPFDCSEDSESSVSDFGLIAISQGCRKLRSILYFCQRMTNAAVATMSENCPELVVFRLCIMGRHRPDHLTREPMDEGFGAIVMNCRKLTRLAVSGLLTDEAFRCIGKYGKLLRTLSVAFAGNSDLSLRYILEGCPKLQKLEIRASPFGDAGLLSGIHHYYNMRFLWMSSCKLSIRGCREVARRLPRLVVEVIRDKPEENDVEAVEKLYMYRSLAGRRDDAPPFVEIL